MRLDRIVRDRRLDEAEAMKMIAAQMPADLKRARANYVIENDGSIDALREQVDRLWEKLSRDDVSSLSTADVP
jgi:dephospho-CoA kinase